MLKNHYKEKGYNEHAAQAMAVEAMEGRQEPPEESIRFARIYGLPDDEMLI